MVHQCGLAVVDVGDDRDIANLHRTLRCGECCAAHIGADGAMCECECAAAPLDGTCPPDTKTGYN
jgi:hypothetical protein